MDKKPHTDWALIVEIGGPTEVSRRLGWDNDTGAVQRIQNWKYRGIPALLRYQREDVFGPVPVGLDSAA